MSRVSPRLTALATAALRREYDRLGDLVDLVGAGKVEPAEVRAALWAAERLLASTRSGLDRSAAARPRRPAMP